MDDDPGFEKVKQNAFRLLARRARSEKELRDKLKEKKFESGVIDRVVSRLSELNYLDDEAFARQWVRHLAINKLSGNRKIEASLREKGIAKDLGERMIAEIRGDFPENEALEKLVRRKLKGGRPDAGEKRSLAQYLLGRGFAPDLIFEMIRGMEEGHRHDDRQ
jgi:regulatory protein